MRGKVYAQSIVELHRLNITLSNYFDVAPDIINGITITAPSETMKLANQQEQKSSPSFDILLNKPFGIWSREEHLRLARTYR
jgi:hypothetical protein